MLAFFFFTLFLICSSIKVQFLNLFIFSLQMQLFLNSIIFLWKNAVRTNRGSLWMEFVFKLATKCRCILHLLLSSLKTFTFHTGSWTSYIYFIFVCCCNLSLIFTNSKKISFGKYFNKNRSYAQ